MRHGFYFAYNFELTLTAQKRATLNPQIAQNTRNTVIGDPSGMDIRFMWNYNLCKDFKAQKIPSYWFIKLIQGFVDYQCPMPGAELIMIARRRWKMGGTRYNARGVDQEGNVANHTETEQLVFIHRRHNPPLLTDDPNYTVLATTKVYSYV